MALERVVGPISAIPRESASILPPQRLLLADTRTELADLLSAAQAALPHDVAQVRAYVSRAYDVLTAARNNAGSEFHQTSSAGGRLMEWQLRRVLAMVESRLPERFAVSELAQAARLGPSQFTRAFRTSVGVTPYAYIIQRRVARAKRHMLTTQDALVGIALDCGFADQAHFSRVFRRHVGQGPSLWRRSQSAPADLDGSEHAAMDH